jgi:predicted RNase H-like HicB family nuclease
MTTYRVVCRRSGNWWAINVPDLKGVHTQTRRLDQVPAMAREAIALMLDVDPKLIQVEVCPEVPCPVSHALEARRAARRAEEIADQATAAAARSLLDDGYTVRDAGALLGLSPQRISQIAPTVARPSNGGQQPATRRAVAATRPNRALSVKITPPKSQQTGQ